MISESIVNNSFLFTQVKKLLGNGSLNNNFSNQSLWLPSQSSKLSTAESFIYVNNFNNQVNKLFKTNDTMLNFKQLNNSSFKNLNFFENSRLFLTKKYLFTNNISNNLVTSFFKNDPYSNNSKSLTTSSAQTTFNTNTYLNTINSTLLNTTTPSINTTKLFDKGSITSYVGFNKTSLNLINLNTALLDVINGSNIQFFYLLTSNLNTSNSTQYFSYISSLDASSQVSHIHGKTNIKFYL